MSQKKKRTTFPAALCSAFSLGLAADNRFDPPITYDVSPILNVTYSSQFVYTNYDQFWITLTAKSKIMIKLGCLFIWNYKGREECRQTLTMSIKSSEIINHNLHINEFTENFPWREVSSRFSFYFENNCYILSVKKSANLIFNDDQIIGQETKL